MKKILYTIVIFLIISTFYLVGIAFVFAAGCSGTDCDVSFGETVDITVIPKDEDGNVIVGVPIGYTWEVVTANLGIFTQNNGTSWSETNSAGSSTVTFQSGFTVPVGAVRVTASYGGVDVVTNFSITAFCNRDPILYFGIGAVKDSGDDNWHQSTAELLETCYDEYKLYEGTGGRY